eukprot:CAMPEP_0183312376 /NCGR_PEP_ID=MMETSP0160_2-20130417/41398_1 /TAXON_ID=2839 ORGANISM="Odontella Sinensis, Strain Grunow 1884" /NCGR_SAMPLE_ID=MMETSP0160_2 /ASSEMBLY_ACC=CAM_ASM_000250 /LENGTH=81 /DNA_ID=CAMNT_0025477213 /DNA_START=575 /DNA_END=820 /DNA_ORIENTATION=-
MFFAFVPKLDTNTSEDRRPWVNEVPTLIAEFHVSWLDLQLHVSLYFEGVAAQYCVPKRNALAEVGPLLRRDSEGIVPQTRN